MADRTKFERIVDKFQTMMYITAFQMVKDKQIAEDIVQETWIKVLKQGEEAIAQVEKLGPWLKTITTRTAIDQLRKEKRSYVYLFQEASWIEEMALYANNFVEECLNYSLLLEELEQSMSKYPKLLRVFQLKFRLGCNDQQIAQRLQISKAAVKTRVFRVRELLKQTYITPCISTA
ncbi:RNA polymerase sigma factor [Gracilibacillus alcaliphilus]|uniref:RNA polymerase sigma factor n=1 Tax=Gracilibacillus alcaliphilus TaxID=1401441 RepID=UPI00308437FE|nr:RNA polymerase sigma-70 factor (ECF subfamily) [Gracilibacillus alcaliphilus]